MGIFVIAHNGIYGTEHGYQHYYCNLLTFLILLLMVVVVDDFFVGAHIEIYRCYQNLVENIKLLPYRYFMLYKNTYEKLRHILNTCNRTTLQDCFK
jgi:hypothetical protein